MWRYMLYITLVVLPFVLSTGPPTYDCVTRTDCTDHGDCVNGACKCDAGWGGTHCQLVLGCHDDAACSYHGSCVDTTCKCFVGWTGTNCEQHNGCDLVCYHGGQPAADCKSCVSCAQGWTGKQCQQYSGTDLTAATKAIQLSASNCQAARSSLLNSLEHPGTPSPVSLGYNPVTRETKLPVVRLTFDDGKTRTSVNNNVFSVPDNVDFEALLGRDYPSTTSDVYYDVDEYIEFVHELASSLHGRAGVYTDSKDLKKVYDDMFTHQRFYSVNQVRVDAYKNTLLRDHSGSPVYELDSQLAHIMSMLPLNLTTANDKALYYKLYDYWGTHYMSDNIVSGGLAASEVSVNHCVADKLTFETLKKEVENDFKVELHKSSQPINPYYSDNRHLSKLSFFGGSPNASPDAWDAWTKSVDDNPIAIDWEFRELTTLVNNPKYKDLFQDPYKLASNVALTISEYLQNARAAESATIDAVHKASQAEIVGAHAIAGGVDVSSFIGKRHGNQVAPIINVQAAAGVNSTMTASEGFLFVIDSAHGFCYHASSVVSASCDRLADGRLVASIKPGNRACYKVMITQGGNLVCEWGKGIGAFINAAPAKSSTPVKTGCTEARVSFAIETGMTTTISAKCCMDAAVHLDSSLEKPEFDPYCY